MSVLRGDAGRWWMVMRLINCYDAEVDIGNGEGVLVDENAL